MNKTDNELRKPYSYDIPGNHGLNGGENYFQVRSYEVYKIEY